MLVTGVAAAVRGRRLRQPAGEVLDEVYYSADAWSLLRFGVETRRPASATGAAQEPAFVAHPPLGKWVIAAGQRLFGDTAVGRRLPGAVLGTASVLVLCRAADRMLGGPLAGSVTGSLLALDGLHVVMSRTAMLDGPLTFFVVSGLGCLVADRDQLGARVTSGAGTGGPRPWLIGAAAAVGCASAVKWAGAAYAPVYALFATVQEVAAQRLGGRVGIWPAAAAGLRSTAVFTAVPLAVYLASWLGWFRAGPECAWRRDWASSHPPRWPRLHVPGALRGLADYHRQMAGFGLGVDRPHTHQSAPWHWLTQTRPVVFWYRKRVDRPRDRRSEVIVAVGNPALWWTGAAVLPVLAWQWLARRDGTAALVLAGIGAGYVPWFFLRRAQVFSFYAVVFAPFMALAVGCALRAVAGGPSPRRRAVGGVVAAAQVTATAVGFARMWPMLSARGRPPGRWPRWIWPGWR